MNHIPQETLYLTSAHTRQPARTTLFGGVSPPCPNRRTEREQELEKQEVKTMKNNKLTTSTILSLSILTMFLTALILPVAQCFDTPDTHGHYTINEDGVFVFANRCDHLVDPPGADPDNAFTACGISGERNNATDAYVAANYTYIRGFGGPAMTPHSWTCNDISLMCGHQVDATTTYTYDSRLPVWNTTAYGWWWNAYYQRLDINIPGLDAYTVGAKAGSFFDSYPNPNQRIYISSLISANYMYAENPTQIDSEY